MRAPWLAGAAAVALAAACVEPGEEFDSKPIALALESDGGALLATVSANGGPLVSVVVDTAAPLSAFPLGADARARELTELRVVRADRPDVTRAIFSGVPALNGDRPPLAGLERRVGVGDGLAVAGVLGADLLGAVAARFVYRDVAPGYEGLPTVTLFPDNPLDDRQLEDAGEAVLHVPLLGGGTLALGDELLPVAATRLVVQACLEPDAPDDPDGCPGTDLTLLIGTGFGPVVLADSAVARLRGAAPEERDTTLRYPGGAAAAATLALGRLVIVDDRDRELGPCGELALRAGLLEPDLTGVNDAVACGDSRCSGDGCVERKRDTRVAAILDVTAATAAVAIADTDPLIDGLRGDVRPQVPELDGILGGAYLRRFVLEIDYPHQRVIVPSCADDDDAACFRGRSGKLEELP